MFCPLTLTVLVGVEVNGVRGGLLASATLSPAGQGQFSNHALVNRSRTATKPHWVLEQTRDGYLMGGTWYGLVRFNGLDFTVFIRLTRRSLEGITINALDETGGRNLVDWHE